MSVISERLFAEPHITRDSSPLRERTKQRASLSTIINPALTALAQQVRILSAAQGTPSLPPAAPKSSLWDLCFQNPLSRHPLCVAHLLRIKKLPPKEQSVELHLFLYYLACEEFPAHVSSLLDYRLEEIKEERRTLKASHREGCPNLEIRYRSRVFARTLLLSSGLFLIEGVDVAYAILPAFCDPTLSVTGLGMCPEHYTRLTDTFAHIQMYFSAYKKILTPFLDGTQQVHPSLRKFICADWGLSSKEPLTPLRTAWTCLLSLFEPAIIQPIDQETCYFTAPLNASSPFFRLQCLCTHLVSGYVKCEGAKLWLAPPLLEYAYDPTALRLSYKRLQEHPVFFQTTLSISDNNNTLLPKKTKPLFPIQDHQETYLRVSSYFQNICITLQVLTIVIRYLNDTKHSHSPRSQVLFKIKQNLDSIPKHWLTKISASLTRSFFFIPSLIGKTYTHSPDSARVLLYKTSQKKGGKRIQNIVCKTFAGLKHALLHISPTIAPWLSPQLFVNALSAHPPLKLTKHTHLIYLFNKGGYTKNIIQFISPKNAIYFACIRDTDSVLTSLRVAHQRSRLVPRQRMIAGYQAAPSRTGHAFVFLTHILSTYSTEELERLIAFQTTAAHPATTLLDRPLTTMQWTEVAAQLSLELPIESLTQDLGVQKKIHPFYIAFSLHLWGQAHKHKILFSNAYLALCTVLEIAPVILCGTLNWQPQNTEMAMACLYVLYYDPIQKRHSYGKLEPHQLQPLPGYPTHMHSLNTIEKAFRNKKMINKVEQGVQKLAILSPQGEL